MEVWSGELQLQDGPNVKDVRIFTPSSSSQPSLITSSANLHFLTRVQVCEIPLALVAGPSYEVWTQDPATIEWFSKRLLQEPISTEQNHNRSWFDGSRESYIGILARVDHDDDFPVSQLVITELMFYAILNSKAQGEDGQDSFKVLAVPLSSHNITKAASHPFRPASPDLNAQEVDDNVIVAHFIPDSTSATAPRKSAHDIFETANELRRKTAGRGGAGIQAAAAGLSQARVLVGHKKAKPSPKTVTKSLLIDTNVLPGSSLESPALVHVRQNFRRSPSLSSGGISHSRKDSSDFRSKDSLSKYAGVQKANQSTENSFEPQNKETVSRLIMAGMRLYGLKSGKKPEKDRESPSADAESSGSEEEYKTIYHLTYRAVLFAFVSVS
jgi:hypothetical protein